MLGRAMVAAGLGGVLGAHRLADLPGGGTLALVSCMAGLAAWAAWRAGRGTVRNGGAMRRVGACWAERPGAADHRAGPMEPAWRRGSGPGRGALLRASILCLLSAWAGFVFTVLCAQARLAQALADGNVDRVSRVTLRVDSLPRLQPDRLTFEAVVLDAHPGGVPERVRVRWPAAGWRGPYAPARPPDPPFPEVRPGQVWRMALVLRPVRAAQNRHAFDAEAHAFAAGIRAQGTVRGTPEWLRDEDWAGLSVIAGRARHAVREAMAPHLQGLRYGPVLRALAIGDQDGVDDADWAVFNRTGITHLVSISGSHITLLAGAGGLAVYGLWRRLRWRGRCLAERWPARRAGALAALLVAWLYCLLAGWGVPARRTFMMLAVVAGAQTLQLRVSGSRVLALAAAAVVLTDPWAVLAGGFWLSFLAVAVLLAVSARAENAGEDGAAGERLLGDDRTGNEPVGNEPVGNEPAGNESSGNEPIRNGRAGGEQAGDEQAGDEQAGDEQAGGGQAGNRAAAVPRSAPGARPAERRRDRWLRGLMLAARLQWAITWALAPPLAWTFHEVSLVSPLANAYAIPVIELLVTPLSLLLAGVALVPGLDAVAAGLAWLAHGTLVLMMRPTEWLAALPAWPVPAGPAWLYLLALAGAAVALWPGGGSGGRPSGERMAGPFGEPAEAGRTAFAVPGRGGDGETMAASHYGAAAHWTAPSRRRARGWADPLRRRRAWAWLALLPMLLWPPARPADGEWDLRALDVGQGSALLVRTARHTLLFDAGARHARDADEGVRTIVPALKALGVRRLDALVVSHADLDHAGGVRSVLAAVPVAQAFASFDLDAWLRAETRKLGAADTPLPRAAAPCRFGDRWRLDGVEFEFLWPLDVRARRPGAEANAGSCVLRVRGAHHSLLLTGDIEIRAETALVERGLTPADVVVAAHHGSRTSSSAAFVGAAAARHVIFQAGAWNRHGHPDTGVLERWRRAGATLWRTDLQGGIDARSRAEGLTLSSVLESSRRHWHGREVFHGMGAALRDEPRPGGQAAVQFFGPGTRDVSICKPG